MKVTVRYYSRGGNTKKLADAIAEAVGVETKTTSEPLTEDVDLLFLGSSVYAYGVDDRVKRSSPTKALLPCRIRVSRMRVIAGRRLISRGK